MRARLLIVCIGTYFGISSEFERANADMISLDPAATYLLVRDETPPAAPAIGLSALSISAGDTVRLEQLGDYQGFASGSDNRTRLLGVFSASDTLLARTSRFRVQDAIDAGADVETQTTFIGDFPTDIPEDFLISDGSTFSSIEIEVPVGALFLFVSVDDRFFQDNTDPDGDFKLQITKLSADPVPEPSSLVLLGMGGLGMSGCGWRRRRKKKLAA